MKRRSLQQLLIAPVDSSSISSTGSASDLWVITVASGVFSALVFVVVSPLGPNLRNAIVQGLNWAHIWIPPLISLVLYSFSFVMLLRCHQILSEDINWAERKELSRRLLPRLPILLVPPIMLPIGLHLIRGQQLRSTFAVGRSDFVALAVGVAFGVLHYILFIHLPYTVGQRTWKRTRLADLRQELAGINQRIAELRVGVAADREVSPSDFAEYVHLDTLRERIPSQTQETESLSVHPYRPIELLIAFVYSNLATVFLFVLALTYLVVTGNLASYIDAIKAGDWIALMRLLLDLFK
jgi:hypothetical protein